MTAGAADPADARPAVGPGWPRPTRCGAAPAKGSHAIAFSENPSKLGFPSLYSGEWDVLWHACMETDDHGVDAHRVVLDDARHEPRRAARHHDGAQRAERRGLAVRLGVLGHALAFPGAEDRVRGEPDRLDALPARADGHRRRGGRDRWCEPRPHTERDREGTGLGLRVRRPARPQQPRRGRPRAHPLRDRLPAHRRHLAGVPGRRAPALRDRGDGRSASATPSSAATRSAATGSTASASPSSRGDHAGVGQGRACARPSRRRPARRDRPPQPRGQPRARGRRRTRRV